MQIYHIALNQKQPAPPLKTYNLTTKGFVAFGMKPKHSKMWDVKWHWLRDKEILEQLRVYWDKGTNNNSGCFTKNNTLTHHREMRPRYIYTSNIVRTIPQIIRLCEGVLNRVPSTQSWIRYDHINNILLRVISNGQMVKPLLGIQCGTCYFI